MIRWQLFRKFILFRNFGRERVLWEGNADCQEAGELEVTFRCFIAFWLLEHCQKYHDTTMPYNHSFKLWFIGMSTYYPIWGFVLRKGLLADNPKTRLFMQCNPYNPRCPVVSPIVQSGRDKLKTIPLSLTWCLINVANPEYLSGAICITTYICCWNDFIAAKRCSTEWRRQRRGEVWQEGHEAESVRVLDPSQGQGRVCRELWVREYIRECVHALFTADKSGGGQTFFAFLIAALSLLLGNKVTLIS